MNDGTLIGRLRDWPHSCMQLQAASLIEEQAAEIERLLTAIGDAKHDERRDRGMEDDQH